MGIISDNSLLISRFNGAKDLIQTCKNKEERFALYNYLMQLQGIIDSLDGTSKVEPISKKRKIEVIRTVSALIFKQDENFILNKNFHSEYMGAIFDDTAEVLKSLTSRKEIPDIMALPEKMFFEIFLSFLSELGLEDLFIRSIKDKRIFSIPDSDDFYGVVLINPFDRNTDVIIKNFGCSLSNMLTMAHEFGHVYDLSKLRDDDLASKLLEYEYLSIWGEAIPTTFEKLLFRFLIKNDVMPSLTKSLLIDSLFRNRESITVCCFLSMLKDTDLRNGTYANLDDESVGCVLEEFNDPEAIRKIMEDTSLWEAQTYGYAEVMSLFLDDSFQKEGFDGQLFRDFMEERTKPFSREFIESHDLSPERCKTLYKRYVNIIKK